jgi:hypothetical protein
MTTNVKPIPANEPATFPPTHKQTPTTPGLPEKEGEGVDTVADRLAQKGSNAEKSFDKENSKLFNK